MFEFMGLAIALVGLALLLISTIWTFFLAFKEHLAWGIGSLLFSPVGLVFIVLHWPKTKAPTLLYFVGLAVSMVGLWIAE